MSDDSIGYYLGYLKRRESFPINIYHKAVRKVISDIIPLSISPGKNILDAGCGCGYVTNPYSSNYNVIGIDREFEAIEFCYTHLRSGKYLVADVYNLPFKDDFFDLAVFIDTIEHLTNPELALRELRRVLRQGSKIVISTVNCGNIFWRILEILYYRFFGGECKPYKRQVHPWRFRVKTFRNIVEKSFTIEKFYGKNLGMELIIVARKN